MRASTPLAAGLLVAALALSGAAPPLEAQPLSPVRTLPLPAPSAQGLAHGGGSLWTLSSMGPGSFFLFELDPVSGSTRTSNFTSADATALAHDGTRLYGTRDAGTWACGGANPNALQLVDPASGSVVGALPSAVTGSAGDLAFLGSRLFAAGDRDADPCDTVAPAPSIVEMDPATGGFVSALDAGAFGTLPRMLASDGTHLFYGAWVGESGSSTFRWTVQALDDAGTPVESRVLFEVQAANAGAAEPAFRVAGMAWSAGELFVLNLTNGTIQVYDFPSPAPPPPPPSADLAVDVQPGDEENCINLNSHGVTPVAVLGSESFDPASLDLESVRFAGAAVRVKPNGKLHVSEENVDGDQWMDLLFHFETQALELTAGDTEATLSAVTADGGSMEGSDAVKVTGGGESVESPRRDHPGNGRGLSKHGAGAAAPSFGLELAGANPSRGALGVSFALASGEPATLELVSVRGRLVRRAEVGSWGPGTHRFDFGAGVRLAPGLYVVRLTQGERRATAKASVVP